MADTKKTTTTKEVKLNPLVWEAPYNADLVAQVLHVYFSNERKGTASAKTRGDVRGGGKKPWKQKGTGRARHGSIRSPIWVGGGVTFGSSITNRNWSRKINKKMARKATAIMLSSRLKKEELKFITIPAKKGTELRKFLIKDIYNKTIIITKNEDVKLAMRNVENVKVYDADKINAKHAASGREILIDNAVVKILEERLTNGK